MTRNVIVAVVVVAVVILALFLFIQPQGGDPDTLPPHATSAE